VAAMLYLAAVAAAVVDMVAMVMSGRGRAVRR